MNPAQPVIVRSERLSVPEAAELLNSMWSSYCESKGRRGIGSFPTFNPSYLLLLNLPIINGTTTKNTLSGQLWKPSIFFCPCTLVHCLHTACALHPLSVWTVRKIERLQPIRLNQIRTDLKTWLLTLLERRSLFNVMMENIRHDIIFKEPFVARCRQNNSIKNFTSHRMNRIINAKRFDRYAAIIISGTIQRQRCDACLNTVGYGQGAAWPTDKGAPLSSGFWRLHQLSRSRACLGIPPSSGLGPCESPGPSPPSAPETSIRINPY